MGERARELERLEVEVAALRAERDKLIESRIEAWPGGGYAVTLPFVREGYPSGELVAPVNASLFYHFEDRAAAVAAVRRAAGLGEGRCDG